MWSAPVPGATGGRVAFHLGHDVVALLADPVWRPDELIVLDLVGEGNQDPERCVEGVEASARLPPDAYARIVGIARLHGGCFEVERDVRIGGRHAAGGRRERLRARPRRTDVQKGDERDDRRHRAYQQHHVSHGRSLPARFRQRRRRGIRTLRTLDTGDDGAVGP